MRNFVPLSLLVAAASLAALGTPSLHADRLAAAPPAYGAVPANGTDGQAGQPVYEPTLDLTVPQCARHAPCAIRQQAIWRPMT
ncbi:MAG TPA: hypothetical protein VL528_02675 [Oxalicibacterium sp.]|jgi:hypothetical protein|nr:hypothetical protein [Oxalicibacterium sp.]